MKNDRLRTGLHTSQKVLIFLALLCAIVNLLAHNWYIALLWILVMLDDWIIMQYQEMIERRDEMLDESLDLVKYYREKMTSIIELLYSPGERVIEKETEQDVQGNI